MRTPTVLMIILVLLTGYISSLMVTAQTGPDIVGVPGPVAVTPSDNQTRSPFNPVILSQFEGNKVVSLWAGPSPSPCVLYDQWQIMIYGEEGEQFSITINGREIFTGILLIDWLNLSYNAGEIDRANVTVEIGARFYRFSYLIINHQDIGYVPNELRTGGGGYDLSDLRWAQFKGAVGVLITSLALMPVVWWAVRTWRNKQGVVQW